jgi:hypothetical protein
MVSEDGSAPEDAASDAMVDTGAADAPIDSGAGG